MTLQRIAFHWSGGKDSALALQMLLADPTVQVDRLLTTVNPDRGDSVVHGIPIALLEAQAARIGVPLETIPLPGASWDGYLDAMRQAAQACKRDGIDAFAFGDLECSGMRATKVEQFAPFGIDVVLPLWGRTSPTCAAQFVASGIKAVTIVVDADALDATFVGRSVDLDFVASLPSGVDPCGEFGEYHTLVFDGPLFASPLNFELSDPEFLERSINTTEGLRTYHYWTVTPRLVAAPALVR